MSPNELDPELILSADAELRRLAEALLRERSRGDDAAQEAWLAAMKGRGPDRPGSLRRWLDTAMRHRIRRGHRGDERRAAHERAAARSEAVELTPADILEQQAVRQCLVEAVVALDEPYRRTMILRFFEGLPPRDVARRMKVPVETVRTRTRRALDVLRSRLDRDFGDRASWCAPLVVMATVGAGRAGAFSIGSTFQGAMLMSAKSKIASVAVLVAVLGFVVWYSQGDDAGSGFETDERAAAREDRDVRRATDVEEDEADVAPSTTEETTDEQTPPSAAEQAPTGEAVGRLEIKLVRKHDGKPVADAPVRLLPFAVKNPFFRELCPRTDSAGLIVLDEWPAGRMLAVSLMGGSKRFTVKADDTTRETIEVPHGIELTGIVVTPDGSPVAGAEIVVGEMGHPVRGGWVTRTNPDGRFEVPNFGADTIGMVGARARGWIGSPMVMVFPSPGASKELRLELGGRSAQVEIVVTDGDERPLAGARVVVGKAEFKQFPLKDGTTAMSPAAWDTRTDEEGRVIVDLPPGKHPLEARHSTFAPHTTTLDLKVGENRYDAMLGAGGIVHGRVVDGNDQPLERCEITVGRYGTVSGHYTRTDEDGRFRLENVAPGEHEIRAEKSKMGEQKATVRVIAGEETEWNARLVSGPSIVGVILDDSGNPVAGLAVAGNGHGTKRYLGGFARTDGMGRFEMKDLVANIEYSLTVRGRDGLSDIHRHPVRVKPGPAVVRIVVPANLTGVAALSGLVLGAQGEALGGARVSARRMSGGGSSGGIITTDGEGRFRIEKIVPGRYRFTINADGYGYQYSKEYEIADGEDRDLGAIRLDAPGHVRITLDNPSGLSLEGLRVYATRKSIRSTIVIHVNGVESLSQPMAPDEWELSLQSKTIARLRTTTTVRSGETSEARLELMPGRPFEFVFVGGPGNEVIPSVHLTVVDERGKVFIDRTVKSWRGNHVNHSTVLPEGRHTLKATDELGRSVEVKLGAEESGERTLTLR